MDEPSPPPSKEAPKPNFGLSGSVSVLLRMLSSLDLLALNRALVSFLPERSLPKLIPTLLE